MWMRFNFHSIGMRKFLKINIFQKYSLKLSRWTYLCKKLIRFSIGNKIISFLFLYFRPDPLIIDTKIRFVQNSKSKLKFIRIWKWSISGHFDHHKKSIQKCMGKAYHKIKQNPKKIKKWKASPTTHHHYKQRTNEFVIYSIHFWLIFEAMSALRQGSA